MRKLLLSFILPAFLIICLNGQNHQETYESIDVISYGYMINLFDHSDEITGIAQIEVMFKQDLDQFQLDLGNYREGYGGMVVESINENGRKVPFLHQDDELILSITGTKQGSIRKYLIAYRGVPTDGLIISKNKFGDRTFFGDNWPNRGHHWLPMVDHPSDKALVEFTVTAPEHYKVVSVGQNFHEEKFNGRIISQWKTSVPISTKLMVIGVSPFAVDHFNSRSGVPVSSWVYPQNQKEGFYDYSIASRPLDFFENYIAPYPYAKLANVQSKTVYGGMENASCIFYNERTVNGKQDHETLFAHEIAHQWFGDAVSELNWHHIWLSEGFATYLTDLYIEQTHGREAFVASLMDEKKQVLAFARRRLAPVVDTTLPVSVRLLNKNSYEKAGWILHMLRHDLGDEQFQHCIQVFYEKYKFGNALTEDFQAVVDSVSRKSHETFFRQWFYQTGHPVLSKKWDQNGDTLVLTIKQHQDQYVFSFPLEVEIISKSGKTLRKQLNIQTSDQEFWIQVPFKAKDIKVDPDSWLLFEPY